MEFSSQCCPISPVFSLPLSALVPETCRGARHGAAAWQGCVRGGTDVCGSRPRGVSEVWRGFACGPSTLWRSEVAMLVVRLRSHKVAPVLSL
ncbi:hypothetical protein Taro_057030 [Colocasia esculenta]|uniref:Uncharacterized protein n=1 Tax=Colocasia esculenta TaxID=4460 RepID=A0A843XYG8_COLES|nr:hypothetical protein [Colocasia esculenta]